MDETALAELFGELEPGDRYYCAFNEVPWLAAWNRQVTSAGPFDVLGETTLRVFHDVEVLLTRARYDRVSTSSCFAPGLAQHDAILESATVDDAARAGCGSVHLGSLTCVGCRHGAAPARGNISLTPPAT